MPLKQQEFLKTFFKHTSDLIVTTNAEGTVVAVNPALMAEFGYAHDEIVGRKIDILYAGREDVERIGKDHFNRHTDGPGDLYRFAYRKKSGQVFIGETREIVARDEAGQVSGFARNIRNITGSIDRERLFLQIASLTGDASLSVASRLQALLNVTRDYLNASAAMLTITVNCPPLQPNDVLTSEEPGSLGADESVVGVMAHCVFVPPRPEATHPAAMGDPDAPLCVSEPLIIDGETLGELRFMQKASSAPLFSGYSIEVRKTIGAVFASQIKLAQQNHALELSETRFRNLYRKTPAIMHSIDRQGNLREVSEEWLRVFKYRREDVIGQKLTRFMDEESRTFAITESLPRFWTRGFSHRVPYRLLTSDGVPVHVEISGILDDDGNAMAVLEDVTKRIAAQDELLEKNAALQIANEELNRFTFIASHDLQEPLRKIRAFCNMLADAMHRGDTQECEYAMSVLHKSAERSSHLISDLLTLSRINNREFIPVTFPIGATVRETLATFSTKIQESGAEVTVQECEAEISGDRTAFVQLLWNLVSNAIKYHAPDARPQVRILIEADDKQVILKVVDAGIGIESRFAQIVFEPFKRLHTQTDYPGTGIGLAICRKIADRHGWRIGVEEMEKPGSCFKLVIAR